jgi:RsmE family RNA methyltransferase
MNIILFNKAELALPLQKHDERAEHLLKVLHKHPGDQFDAGVLDGPAGHGTITRIDNNGAVYVSFTPDAPDVAMRARLPLTVAVGFPRPIQLRRILRELSSIGVGEIVLFPTELGERSYRDTTLFTTGAAQHALIEGAAQSRDTTLPTLTRVQSLAEWLDNLPPAGARQRIVADNTNGSRSFISVQPACGFVLAVGNERGWSVNERERLREAGFDSRSLGSRALRTETACAACAALLAMLC